MAVTPQPRETQKKKATNKTRRKLMALLHQLNEDCKKLKEIDNKADFFENKLMPVLKQYAQESGFPQESLQSIQNDIDQFDTIRGNLSNSCDFLEKVKNFDPSLINAIDHPFLAGLSEMIFSHAVLLGALILGAIVLGFAWNSIKSSTITLEIQNNGCAPIPNPPVVSNLPLFSFWKQPIPNGGSDVAILPPINVRVDATDSNNVTVYLLNLIPVDLGQAGAVQSIKFNGNEIMHQVSTLNFSTQGTNSVVIACN